MFITFKFNTKLDKTFLLVPFFDFFLSGLAYTSCSIMEKKCTLTNFNDAFHVAAVTLQIMFMYAAVNNSPNS